MDDTFFGGNGLSDATALVLNSPATSKKSDVDEVPDYNEAFPQLRSAGQGDVIRSSTFFSTPFPSSTANGKGAMASTTTAMHSSAKIDEERRRTMAIHASSATTKIVSDASMHRSKRPASLQHDRERENICFGL